MSLTSTYFKMDTINISKLTFQNGYHNNPVGLLHLLTFLRLSHHFKVEVKQYNIYLTLKTGDLIINVFIFLIFILLSLLSNSQIVFH